MRVVHCKREPYDVLIDRRTQWGNPFKIGEDCSTRAQAIAYYKEWIWKDDQAPLRKAAKRELRGKTLGCWCAPRACHGDVLLEIANS